MIQIGAEEATSGYGKIRLDFPTASDFPAVCLALGAACAHPVAGAHWRALKSSQSLEPEEVVLQEGSSLPF